MFLIFSSLILLLFALANIYIYRRLFRRIFLFKYFHRLFIPLLILLFLAQAFFFFFRSSTYMGDELYGTLALLFAPTYCFFFITLLVDLVRLGLFIRRKIKRLEPRPLPLLARLGLDCLTLGLGVAFIYFSINSALRLPEVKEIELAIPGLDRDLRLVMLADLHLGKNLHQEFLDKLITQVNELGPDLIAIVGDLIDADPAHMGYISQLNELNSTYGTFYVLGNHEYFHGINEVLALLRERTNMKILINDNINLGFINIAGLGDLAGFRYGLYGPDLARVRAVIASQNSTQAPSILLAHQPKIAQLYELGDFDLVLSGHTHAGQIFPIMFLVKLQQGFLHGLYELGERTRLYVSSGAGFWGPSMRVLAPNETVLFKLKKG